VSQGFWGVRRAPPRLAAIHPRPEPYALTSARTDPCGGYRVTGIPTATVTRESWTDEGRNREYIAGVLHVGRTTLYPALAGSRTEEGDSFEYV
jgi:hypothetical protein